MTRPRDLPAQEPGPKRKSVEATPEVRAARQSAKATQPTLKVKKNARSRWLLEVAKETHAQGGTWATLGTMTYRFERPKHPHTGKAIVQLPGPTVELCDVEPQDVKDMDGQPLQVYWARKRGQAQTILTYPPYVLAIVTAEHTAGGTAAGLEKHVPETGKTERTCGACSGYLKPRWDCAGCGGTGVARG